MSGESEENTFHIEDVDVDELLKENGLKGEITCDSGVDTQDSCSAAFPTSSPNNDNQVNIRLDHETKSIGRDSPLSSPFSISPEADVSDNLLNNNAFSLEDKDISSNKIDHISITKDANIDKLCKNNGNVGHNTNNSLNNDSNYLSQSNDPIQINSYDIETDCKALENTNSRNLTMSTMSLNGDAPSNKKNVTMCKSPYSRSAENITTVETGQQNQSFINSSTKDLNVENILSQFSVQKSKASATQKLIPDNTAMNSDLKYTRLPKELLSQDLGSIVKNVHGIFSSVSGSLKNAYIHNTQRVNVQKPVKNVKPNIPKDQIKNHNIEDDNTEGKSSMIQINGIDKQNIPKEISNSNLESLRPISEMKNEMDSDPKGDVLRLQIESLERVLLEQRKENTTLRERIKQQTDELQEKDQVFKDLENKMDLMSKRVDQAEREKDAAVMRYASVECAAIEAKRAAETATKNERAAIAEVELLKGKLKSAHSEKHRICQLYDDKCHELQNVERDAAKTREDLRELEGRLKWTQSKLRMEMDAYKDSAERVEKLSQQVSELEAAKDAAVANATDSVRARQLEAELKENRAVLILCRHEKDELEKKLASVTQQLDTCKRERDTASTALAHTTAEVEKLKESNLRLEEEAAELAAMRAQAALADTLGAQLQRETERAAQAEESASRERARADTCARREAAALEHAARLTAQHVAHRAAAADTRAKAQAMELDNASLRTRCTELEAEVERLRTALAEEAERRNKENRVLARKVAELTEEVAEASQKLEWEKGENGVLKKKHASAIKELNRELGRSLKRCEQLEAKLSLPETGSNRTGSVSSLSSGESVTQDERLQNGHADAMPDIQVREPDRQALIERVVSLQRALARRSERCDFLEEHSRQLTGELRDKARLLRHLLATLPAGALASLPSDRNKKEIARLGGGAMAALWGGDPSGMPSQLALEMLTRLQALLEDTLLKNITLKENMDTLGEEIARLKQERQKNATAEAK